MYVPRFGETNIVYDVINGNNILTTKEDNTYGTITIQDGILTHSNNESNFNGPDGILYGSTTADGKWSLESTEITDGIFTRSNSTLVFNQPDGLIYGKTDKETWSLDSVIIDKGILTKSNNTLGFNSHTGILYGSATGDTWSLKSTEITDGIFTRSNSTLGFNHPTGLLYGSTKDGVWSLSSVDNINYQNDVDYVLYYSSNANGTVTPQWKILKINGKNFTTETIPIAYQWYNMVINPDTCNIVSIQTERLDQQEYGIYNYNGKVVKLSPKVINDIGFKIFPSSEINETGYVTTNVIIYNSSTTDVTFPVNYYNVINFHSNKKNNSNSNMFNIVYTKGFYNYITVSNSLPIYDQVKNTYTGFYNFINSNVNNDTNDTNNYLHFTTTLNVDSIYMPKPDTNVEYFTYIDNNSNTQIYNFDDISNYKCVISISTNFSKIQANTFYQNMFFCNPTTPVLSDENTDVLLGYLIVDLSTIDKSTGKVNINQLIDIDSTIPYNTNISNLTVEELKNGLLTFKPQYYISNNNSIISLYYDDNTNGIFTDITEILPDSITLNNNPYSLQHNDYTYNGKYLRLNNKFFINSNTKELYQIGTIIIPTRGIESAVYNSISNNTTVYLKYLYCDTSANSNIYNIDNCLQPYTYITIKLDGKNNLLTNPALGYTITDTDLCRVYLNTVLPLSHPAILLNPTFYYYSDNIIVNKLTEQKINIFSNVSVGDDNVITINDDTVVNFYINEFNDLVYNNDSNISFLHDTYIFNQYIQIDNSLLYINSETSNIHALVEPNKDTEITSHNMFLHTKTQQVLVKIYSSNNLYTSQGKYNRNISNSNLYTIVDNSTIYYVYETRPIIYNKNYISHDDLIVKYYNDALTNTPNGIIYDNHYIFSKHDIHINALGQIVVNTDKYYYNSDNSAIYSIYNDSDYVLSSGKDIDIVCRQYIELTDKNFFISSFTNNFVESENTKSYLLCKTLIPSNSFEIKTYPTNNTIQLITDPYYGLNSYGNNITLNGDNNIKLHGNNALINKLPFILNSDVQNIERNNTSIQVTLNSADLVILTQQGLSKDNTSITNLTTTDGIIFTDEYTDIPLFDTPIEKDMKVVLKPISKYSILSYNNISYTDQIYTLAKNVGFKISLCNIYVTLTSYIGEYPSMIHR